jgi:hypothetical protein
MSNLEYVFWYAIAIFAFDLICLPFLIKSAIDEVKNYKQQYGLSMYYLQCSYKDDPGTFIVTTDRYEDLLQENVDFYVQPMDKMIPLSLEHSRNILKSKYTNVMLGMGKLVQVWYQPPVGEQPTFKKALSSYITVASGIGFFLAPIIIALIHEYIL